MAQRKIAYKDINQVMKALRSQVIDGLDYYCEKMPFFANPEQMFSTFKNLVKYKNDPSGIELLQCVPTFVEKNYWGVPFTGDCDCFSIFILTACCCHNWNEQRIVLAGRSKIAPVHIWTEVKHNGKWHAMDLTQPFINTTRNYKFKQYLYI
jgi:hypothetical protein